MCAQAVNIQDVDMYLQSPLWCNWTVSVVICTLKSFLLRILIKFLLKGMVVCTVHSKCKVGLTSYTTSSILSTLIMLLLTLKLMLYLAHPLRWPLQMKLLDTDAKEKRTQQEQ